MNTIMSLFGGWQIKLAIVIFVLGGLFTYHKIEVNKAVTQATSELKLQYSKEVFRQIEIAKDETIKLREEKDKSDAEYQKNMQSANTRYVDLRKWVSNLPKSSGGGNNPRSTGDTETRPDDIIGELRRVHAEELSRYSLRAETLRQSLLTCYQKYDAVKDSLDKLRLQNSPGKP